MRHGARAKVVALPMPKLSLGAGKTGPIYAQLRDHIAELITGGALVPSSRLPPVRQLAQELKLNPLTVARAYKELAQADLIETRGGGGTFVRTLRGTAAPKYRNGASETGELAPPFSVSARLYELAAAPGVIAFTGNYPAAGDADLRAFQSGLAEIVRQRLDPYFRYEPPAGRLELRREIARFVATQGITTAADDVIVTAGGQQALDLTVRLLVPPRGTVLVERPTYFGLLNALGVQGARIVEVPLEADGPQLDVLERQLRAQRPRLICLNPTFQNPTGTTASIEKRRAILALARQYGVAIFEDDHCPELRYEGAAVPPIKALAEPEDEVYYGRGFGKVFLPGIRLGFLLSPAAARQKVLAIKASTDLQTNALMQEALARYLASGAPQSYAKRMRKIYAERQRAMLQALRKDLPPGCVVERPEGGLNLWLSLPEGTDTRELYFQSVRRGVAAAPGEVFYAANPVSTKLRLSFGLVPPQQIGEGVRRLSSVVDALLNPARAGGAAVI